MGWSEIINDANDVEIYESAVNRTITINEIHHLFSELEWFEIVSYNVKDMSFMFQITGLPFMYDETDMINFINELFIIKDKFFIGTLVIKSDTSGSRSIIVINSMNITTIVYTEYQFGGGIPESYVFRRDKDMNINMKRK